MAKKDFTKSIGSKNLSSLIPTDEPKQEKKEKPLKQARVVPEKKKAEAPKASKVEQKSNHTTVTTFRVNTDNLFALKAVAFWERKKIQDVLNDALETYLNTIPESTLKKAKLEFGKREE